LQSLSDFDCGADRLTIRSKFIGSLSTTDHLER
jgi:hypothetical protein